MAEHTTDYTVRLLLHLDQITLDALVANNNELTRVLEGETWKTSLEEIYLKKVALRRLHSGLEQLLPLALLACKIFIMFNFTGNVYFVLKEEEIQMLPVYLYGCVVSSLLTVAATALVCRLADNITQQMKVFNGLQRGTIKTL